MVIMNRKAQGMSINTVIIAAIALIVLVVLVAIFTGRIGMFSKGIGDVTGDSNKKCSEVSGVERTRTECLDASGIILSAKEVITGKVCCSK